MYNFLHDLTIKEHYVILSIAALRKWGTVLTEDVGQAHSPETDPGTKDKWIHDRDVDWLHEADVVVAEVTQPSLGVGYEIGAVCHEDHQSPVW